MSKENAGTAIRSGDFWRAFLGFGISRQLQFFAALAAIAAVGITTWRNYSLSRKELLMVANARAMTEVADSAKQLDDLFLRIAVLPRSIASFQEAYGNEPAPGMVNFLRELMIQTPTDEVYGLYIAYENLESLLAFHRKYWPNQTPLEYDYRAPGQEWYRGPKISRALFFTEPYYDEGAGNISMVSLTMPVTGKDREFLGVAGADISLEQVRRLVNQIRIRMHMDEKSDQRDDQVAYLVSRSGRIIAHPEPTLMLRKDFPGAALSTLPAGNEIAAKAEGTAKFKISGRTMQAYWTTSPLTQWKLVLVIPESIVFEPVTQMAWQTLQAGLGGVVLAIVLATILARRFSRPVISLREASAALHEGGSTLLPLPDLARRKDEFGDLARTFETMAARIRDREQKLADWNQNLESMVAQRTSELAEAVKLAEAANRTKSAFLANMSHELRTPMNAVMGYSEMLAEEAAELGQDGFLPDLKKIQSAGKHLLALINDVLDLSKIESGKMSVHCEDIDIPAFVRGIETIMSPAVQKNSNTLEVEFPEDIGMMHSDATKIRQTLFNILGNAAKFTKSGRIRLVVTSLKKSRREYVSFAISDTGIGLKPAQIERIFEPFTQADESTTRKYGGTGLGLAISRRFCRLLGGDIEVQSKIRKGSTFTVTLPRKLKKTGNAPKA